MLIRSLSAYLLYVYIEKRMNTTAPKVDITTSNNHIAYLANNLLQSHNDQFCWLLGQWRLFQPIFPPVRNVNNAQLPNFHTDSQRSLAIAATSTRKKLWILWTNEKWGMWLQLKIGHCELNRLWMWHEVGQYEHGMRYNFYNGLNWELW